MNLIKTVSGLIIAVVFTSGCVNAENRKLADKLSDADLSISIEIPSCDNDTAILCPGLAHDSRKSLMCLMAYEDNLSFDCTVGIIEAAMILELGMLEISHSINACEADADKHCLNVEAGGGRIVSCLRKHEDEITEDCSSALKESGLWDIGSK